MKVKELAKKYEDQVIAWRREFHENPELSWEEVRTGNRICEELTKMNIEFKRIAKTGVLGILKGDKPGKMVSLRADMDALPIKEANDVPYKSKNERVMHACGHDGHTAMLLGAAKILSLIKNEVEGTVIFIFQPAEEMGQGASKMIEAGAMKGVDAILGIHLWADLASGKVSLEPGPRMASTDRFKITIRGKGGHGSMPHQGVDAIVAASAVVMNLQSIVSREISPLEPAVVTIGKFNGGERYNIISEEALMEGTTRCFNPQLRDKFPTIIERMIKETAKAYRAKGELKYIFGHPSVINDPQISQIASRAVINNFEEGSVIKLEKITGGEDFAFYAQEAPGVMALVGARNKSKGAMYPHHHKNFNIDEDALTIGTTLYSQFALDFLKF
ncbi:MAG: M20 family metallopeptidase [Candidatus Bathyarchaeota archaeon]|nr:M20 family metallopeptidase [Candidatus Bathyarchaeota archaeon]